MAFRLGEHTADIAVAAEAESLADAFATTANGLAAAMCDEIPGPDNANGATDRFGVSVTAGSIEALLYDYLADLIYERDVRAVLPADNEATIHAPNVESGPGRCNVVAEWHLDASARAIPLSEIDARDVKAVTYSEMEVTETSEGWRVYVVFDV